MNTMNMKRILLCLLIGISYLFANAQGVVVYKKDGTKIKVPYEQLDSISTYGAGDEPDPSGHEWVDLGLPSGTLWATTNVGASKPEEYGDYFAWGETVGYNGGNTTFGWNTYKYCSGSNKTIWKYCTESYFGTVDNKTMLEPVDDAATANWGEAWQMPSLDQFEELINSNYTSSEWVTINGIYGKKITSKNNLKSIFFACRTTL